MLRKLRPNSIYDVMAAIACFGVLAGGTAYAANTIGSVDIIDGEVKSADIGNGEVGSADVKDNSINTFDVHSFLGADVVDGTLTSADIADFSLGNGDLLTGSVDGRVVTDNSLTGTDIADNSLAGTDINESTLNLPTNTASIAQGGAANLELTPKKVAWRTLPAGNWAVIATANAEVPGGGPPRGELNCLLKEIFPGELIGRAIGTAAQGMAPLNGFGAIYSLTVNGGATIGSGGGEVSLWCGGFGEARLLGSQILLIRVDAFT